MGEFGGAALFLCAFNAVYGLSISVILKRFGSLTRTFIQTAAIVFNGEKRAIAAQAQMRALQPPA